MDVVKTATSCFCQESDRKAGKKMNRYIKKEIKGEK